MIAGLVMVGIATLIATISAPLLFPPMQRQAAQGRLVYGAGAYALAIVAALLARGVARHPMRRLRFVIISVLASLMLWPTFFGSVAISYALVQLTGNRPEGADAMGGLFLWWLMCVSLAHLSRRAATHP
jgi:hypothetical protein